MKAYLCGGAGVCHIVHVSGEEGCLLAVGDTGVVCTQQQWVRWNVQEARLSPSRLAWQKTTSWLQAGKQHNLADRAGLHAQQQTRQQRQGSALVVTPPTVVRSSAMALVMSATVTL